MTSAETRRAFLEFFASRGHRIVPSSPLVLPDDPTLLFANAGMNQFKNVFTGREKRDYTRAASSQKCLRVSGKHNDLEQVGRTPRHHTFFEMLGNFSFGDYFKADAVALAWDLVTRVYGIPEDRLWVTVFGGSEAVPGDDEALALWRDRVGVRPDRILRLGEKDNFWRMGDTGPCGPCSEIHFDLGEDLTSVRGESNPATDEHRYVEIWNLVFMQFEQRDDGSYSPLPAPSIDTGMGLERITAVVQEKRSNYDTDLFTPILEAAAARAGTRYGGGGETDFSLRVVADHARALCFLVADGVVPSNDKRGYVLRRVLRRAIRHGLKLGIREPFLHEVAPAVLHSLSAVYPELLAASDAILEVARREEERFAETISAGIGLLERSMSGLKDGSRTLPGSELFRLYDTFGLPLDLAQDIAEERGVALDSDGFEREMARQRARAQASWKGRDRGEAAQLWGSLAGKVRTRFLGYETTKADGVPVVAVRAPAGGEGPIAAGEEGEILLESTPFYGEAGGQVGDTGWLISASGRARVLDAYRPADGIVAHRVRVEAGRIAEGDTVRAEVDEARREAIRRNHTATHLLHAALREVVGTHVKQAGSLVAQDRLRFDFSHFAALSDRALADIESLMNRKVLQDLPVGAEEMALSDALRTGAMALFGERYGDRVRVIRVGDFSTELCGGTHCARSGEIGLVKVVQERGIAAGTRRIEAVTGEGSLARFREDHHVVKALEELLAVPKDAVVAELQKRIEHMKALQRELEQQRIRSARLELAREASDPHIVEGVKVVAARADALSPQEARVLADGLRQKLGSGCVVIGRSDGAKAYLLVTVTRDLEDTLPAGDVVRELAKVVGGGGGGKKDLAEAGGKDPSRLDEALGIESLSRAFKAIRERKPPT
jgi:alanyl-tRNA synthetase